MSPRSRARDEAFRERRDELFEAALAVPVAEREAFLAERAAGQPSLAEAVQRLLRHHREDSAERSPSLLIYASGGRPVPRTRPPAPELLGGRYRLQGRLGSGAFGTVHRARDERSAPETYVAVKLYHGLNASQWETIRREAGLLRLLRLPGVVEILDEGEDAGYSYLVTKLVEGEPFPGAIDPRDGERLSERTASLLEALAQVHWAGVLHRDLKPENVLVDVEGRVTLIDLGMAHEAAAGPARDRAGTAAYMAPEILRGEAASVRSDLYAVGVFLHELLAGQPPQRARGFLELARERLSSRPPPLASVAPGAPPRLALLTDRLLARDPRERPPTARDALAILGRSLGRDLPWLGHEQARESLLQAAELGRPLDLQGPPGSGRSRCLREVAARLAAEGRDVFWFAEGVPPEEHDLRARLGAGAVLVADDANRLDEVRRGLLSRARAWGCVLSAGGGFPSGLTLPPLEQDALARLFHGPQRLHQLPTDAARELWLRTGGHPRAVVEELEAWVRSGLAHWRGEALVVGRSALARLGAGVWVRTPGEAGDKQAPSPEEDWLLDLLDAAGGPLALDTLAEAAERSLAAVDAATVRLEELGWLTRLPCQRVVARWRREAPPSSTAWAALASTLRGRPARLRVLLAAGRERELPEEVLRVARGAVNAGRLEEAEAALGLGLLVARRQAARDIERELLLERVQLAFRQQSPAALDRALSELQRAGGRSDAQLDGLTSLMHGAVRAARGETEGALEILEALEPFAAPALERWRWAARMLAVRHTHRVDRIEALAGEALSWARHQGGGVIAAAAGWEGWLRYAQRRYEQAARRHAAMADRTRFPTSRLAARLNAASAWMEAGAYGTAAELAGRALEKALLLRHERHAAHAEWILRSLRYRRGDALRPDVELVEAALALASPLRAGLILLTEAAIAWRSGHPEAVELARRAAYRFGRELPAYYAALARALGLAAGTPPAGLGLERLVEDAQSSRASVPAFGLQALGLLAWVSPPERARLARAARPLIEAAEGLDFERRREVISLGEALQALGLSAGRDPRALPWRPPRA